MDRVSNLPDEVLCHILSFLPTKLAALTSVLSKRWLNLWKLVPHLHIDDSVFLHPEEGKEKREEIQEGFVSFVDSILASQGDSPVEKFTLKCITGIHPDNVNRWICNVLRRGVTDLDLFIDVSHEYAEEDEYQLPVELFISTTVVKLKIRSEASVNWWYDDGYMGPTLPMLKSLNINSDLIFIGEIESFLPTFPVLEKLWMANMEWSELDIAVSSETLRKLTLHATGCEPMKSYQNPKTFSFDAPNLISLSYTDLVAEDYPVVNLPNIDVARINFVVFENQIKRIRAPNNDWVGDNDDDGDDGHEVLQFANVVKLMKGIQNVRRLSLLADTLEVLSLCSESMPVFNNVKFLGITSEESRGWQAMPALLRNCPHLETIIFEGLLHHVTDKCGDACDCVAKVDKGRSLRSCPVKMIEIQRFRGTMKEMRIIKHFLDYFPSLKVMKVFIEEEETTQLINREISKLVQEMFKLYNKSSSCNVELLVSGNLSKKWTAQGHMR